MEFIRGIGTILLNADTTKTSVNCSVSCGRISYRDNSVGTRRTDASGEQKAKSVHQWDFDHRTDAEDGGRRNVHLSSQQSTEEHRQEGR